MRYKIDVCDALDVVAIFFFMGPMLYICWAFLNLDLLKTRGPTLVDDVGLLSFVPGAIASIRVIPMLGRWLLARQSRINFARKFLEILVTILALLFVFLLPVVGRLFR